MLGRAAKTPKEHRLEGGTTCFGFAAAGEITCNEPSSLITPTGKQMSCFVDKRKGTDSKGNIKPGFDGIIFKMQDPTTCETSSDNLASWVSVF